MFRKGFLRSNDMKDGKKKELYGYLGKEYFRKMNRGSKGIESLI